MRLLLSQNRNLISSSNSGLALGNAMPGLHPRGLSVRKPITIINSLENVYIAEQSKWLRQLLQDASIVIASVWQKTIAYLCKARDTVTGRVVLLRNNRETASTPAIKSGAGLYFKETAIHARYAKLAEATILLLTTSDPGISFHIYYLNWIME